MKTEVFEDKDAFLRAVQGKRPARGREARPGIPAAPRGEGDHLQALMRLSKQGWTSYKFERGWHGFRHTDGRESEAKQDYAEAIKAAELEANR